MKKQIEQIGTLYSTVCARIGDLKVVTDNYRNLLFRDLGGCPTCKGAKRVVTASYSDGEFDTGPCPDLNRYNHALVPASVPTSEIPEMDTLEALHEAAKVLSLVSNDLDQINGLTKGCMARVNRGRKVPIGTEGVVIAFAEGQSYSRYQSNTARVMIKDANGTGHWTATSNVDRKFDDTFIADLDNLIASISKIALPEVV